LRNGASELTRSEGRRDWCLARGTTSKCLAGPFRTYASVRRREAPVPAQTPLFFLKLEMTNSEHVIDAIERCYRERGGAAESRQMKKAVSAGPRAIWKLARRGQRNYCSCRKSLAPVAGQYR
jgi:hypothetical protein